MSDADQSTDMAVSPGRKRAQLVRLAPIAEQIKEEDKKIQLGLQHSLKHAIKAGQLLSQCKKMIGHGGWLEWFEASEFPFKERTAQRYMSIYHRWKEIAAKMCVSGNPSTLSDLTFTESVLLLAQKEKTPAKRAIGEAPNASNKNAISHVSNDQAVLEDSITLPYEPVLGTNVSRGSDHWLTPYHIVYKIVQVLGRI